MNDEAQKLLMMFIKDAYSKTGKISKKTALEMMKFVATDRFLQQYVTNGDNKAILEHRITESWEKELVK